MEAFLFSFAGGKTEWCVQAPLGNLLLYQPQCCWEMCWQTFTVSVPAVSEGHELATVGDECRAQREGKSNWMWSADLVLLAFLQWRTNSIQLNFIWWLHLKYSHCNAFVVTGAVYIPLLSCQLFPPLTAACSAGLLELMPLGRGGDALNRWQTWPKSICHGPAGSYWAGSGWQGFRSGFGVTCQ